MEAMPQEWTEGRLDELSSKVDRGFEQVDRRFEKVDADIHTLRVEMKTEFAALRRESERTHDRIDSVQRVIAFAAVALTSAIIAGFAAMCTLLAALL
jgi:hypothetical protein